MPDQAGLAITEEEKDDITHVSFDVGGATLMGSDVPVAFIAPFKQDNNFSVSYQTESRRQTEELFSKISEGGQVTMPLEDTFWGAYFDVCTDKYGINWMFDYEYDNPQTE